MATERGLTSLVESDLSDDQFGLVFAKCSLCGWLPRYFRNAGEALPALRDWAKDVPVGGGKGEILCPRCRAEYGL